ncbi:MAG TPA: hypothetical protein VF458_16865 [Ktedonobacteraceae bacterium]
MLESTPYGRTKRGSNGAKDAGYFLFSVDVCLLQNSARTARRVCYCRDVIFNGLSSMKKKFLNLPYYKDSTNKKSTTTLLLVLPKTGGWEASRLLGELLLLDR